MKLAKIPCRTVHSDKMRLQNTILFYYIQNENACIQKYAKRILLTGIFVTKYLLQYI